MTADGSDAVPVGVDAKAPARRQPRRRSSSRSGGSNARATGTATAQSKTSHKAISEAIAKYVVMTSVLYGSYVTSGTSYDSETAIMTDEEASAIADPIAKLIERSSASKYAAAIVGGDDWLMAAAALFSYGQRVAPIQAQKSQQKRDRKPAAEKVQRPAGQPRGRARNGSGRVPENATGDSTVIYGGAGPVTGTPGGYGLGAQHSVDI